MKPTVNFDQHSPEYAANWRQIDRDLRENTPVAWTEAHGGYWIISRHADILNALRDWETFSSENDISGTGNGGKGILIPRNTFQFALSESDPPQSSQLRGFELPFLVAQNVEKWQAAVRLHADEAIDAVIDSGRIDLAHDFCVPVPAKTVMAFTGIPLDDWRTYAFSAQDMTRMPTTHPSYPHEAIAYIQKRLLELVQQRRLEPQGDIISVLTQGRMNGVLLSDAMVMGVVSALVFGGFDTTTTATLNTLIFLDDHPEMRAIVRADPKKKNALVEEILRLHPPTHGIARTVVKDVEFGGQHLKAGDRVFLLFSAANRDPAKFERPDEFWLERPNASQHLSFSFGMHRCLGSIFAKMEIGAMLDALIDRVGDYQILQSEVLRNELVGRVDGYRAVPARFTPPDKQAQAA